MANVKLLDQVMKHIEHNEHLWNQGYWATITVNGWSGEELKKFLLDDPQNPVCGTQRCFAGHAVAFSGWTPIFEISEYTAADYLEAGVSADYCVNKESDRRRIPQLATELLEIDDRTADTLFAPNNSLDDLRRMVAYIKEHDSLERQTCGTCDGSGEHEITVTCSDCDGKGETRWD